MKKKLNLNKKDVHIFIKKYVASIKAHIIDFFITTTNAQFVIYASSSAFFLFLSMVPMLIILCSILPFTPVPKFELIEGLCRLVPDELHSMVESLVNYIYNVQSGVVSISAILTLWSGSSAMMSLINGFNAVLKIDDKRKWLHKRLVAIFYTITLIISTIVIMVLEVFYTPLLSLIDRFAPHIATIINSFASHRHLIVWVFMTLAIALIYRFVPGKRNSKITYISTLPSAALSAIAWSICSRAFAIYLEFANFTIYGSLAVVIILLLWMYVCMLILMVCLYVGEYVKRLF